MATDGRRYRAIIFDLDGTLRANQPEGIEAFIAYASRVGLALSAEQIKICQREAHRYWASARVGFDMQRYDTREFWVNYNRILLEAMNVRSCSDCAQRIQDLFDNEYDPQDILFADARPVLSHLRQSGHRLGLLSNRDNPLEADVERYGLREFFDVLIAAGQVGAYKPEPRVFYHTLEALGCNSPAEAVYVGDNFFADVVGPLNIGMDAILVDPNDIFERYYAVRIRRLSELPRLLTG